MKLREELAYLIWNGEKPGSAEAMLLKDTVDKLEKVVKQWALEMVGEDQEVSGIISEASNNVRQLIRARIEESD
jgi:hypothetical protein